MNKNFRTIAISVFSTLAIVAGIITALPNVPTVIGNGQNVTIKASTILEGNFGTVTVSGTGTEAAPIMVSGGKIKCLVLSGQYIVASGHEVTGCNSHGVFISGQHIAFQFSNVHGNVRENESGKSAPYAFCGKSGVQFGSAVKVYVGGEDILIRGNQVYQNCGEGIGITRGVNVVVSENTVWDNFSVNIYPDNSHHVEIRGNTSFCRDWSYHRPDNTFAFGVLLGAEQYDGWGNQLHDIIIDGNVIDGCRPIRLYSQFGSVQPQNVSITNNIFVNVASPFVNVAGAVASNNVAGLATVILPTPISTPIPQQTGSYYVSVSGNDSNSGTTSNTPFKTIGKCLSVVVTGQTCTVLAGTYAEQVALSKSGVTLIADGVVATKQINVTGSNNVVRGFTIADKTANNGIQVSGNYNLIEDNEIFGTKQDGIWFFGHDNTFRGNYVHDILDPSISGDPHADCFQTWGWQWETYNVLFEGNTCDHTRTSGSNQIVMVANKSQWPIRNLVFRNNTFIMHDAGYSPMNFARKDGQLEISGITIIGNTITNITGEGNYAIDLLNITGAEVWGNVITGYENDIKVVGGSGIMIATPTHTPSATKTPVPVTLTVTRTQTPTPTKTSTPVPTCYVVSVGGTPVGCWSPP